MKNEILQLYEEIYKLKTLVRRGWTLRNLPFSRLESVAEHCFSTSLLALTLINQKKLDLDLSKVLQLLLVHELGEIDFGDVTPFDKVPLVDKHNGELKCVERINSILQDDFLLKLWTEFEENKTKESQFAHIIDKLDAVVQSKIYSSMLSSSELFDEFHDNWQETIKDYDWIFD